MYRGLLLVGLYLSLFGFIHNRPMFVKNEELSFMKRFGYITEENGDIEYAYTWNSLKNTIKKIQKFGGLPQTGVLDRETKKLFSKPRCGVEDILSNQNLRRQKRFIVVNGWKTRKITYYYKNFNKVLGKDNLERLMQNAFDLWAEYGNLKFVPINNTNANINIVFAKGEHDDRYPFDGPGKILAHAFFPFHGDIHFDDDERWGENESGEDNGITDFYSVAAHELGHSLGLAHSPVETSIMFPYYRKPQGESLRLGWDDIQAMYKLYIARDLDETSEEKEDDQSKMKELNGTQYPPIVSKTPTSETKLPAVPDICEAHYSTVAVLRNNLYIFEGLYFWQLSRGKKFIKDGRAHPFHQFFSGLPQHVQHIDAAYERADGIIVLFSGPNYWLFNGTDLIGNERSFIDYGIKDHLESVDAVLLSNINEKTYLFKGDIFWRFDEKTQTLDEGYPKNMTAWRNIPTGLTAAIIWQGDTYFFKGPRYWRFHNKLVIAHDHYPLPTAQVWFGCAETQEMYQYTGRSSVNTRYYVLS